MADIVLNSQLQKSQKFYLPSWQAGKTIDDFYPNLPVSGLPGAWRKTKVPAPAYNAAGGGNIIFQIQSAGSFIADMYLEVQLNATSTGTYTTLPAWSLPTQVRIAHGGNELHNYQYRNVMHYLRSIWPTETRQRFELAAGGTGSGAGSYYAPIPAFWTSYRKNPGDLPSPLPLLASSTNLSVQVWLDTVSNILAAASTGGSIAGVSLVYYEFIVSSDAAAKVQYAVSTTKSYNDFAIDWDQSPVNTSIASGAATKSPINCNGFNGDIAEIDYYAISVATNDTNHQYFNTTDVFTYVDLYIDGTQYYYTNGGNNELLMDSLIFNQEKVGGVTSLPFNINFARRRESGGEIWDGSLNSQVFNTLTLNVMQSSGSAVYVNATAVYNRWYIFDNGLFCRKQ